VLLSEIVTQCPVRVLPQKLPGNFLIISLEINCRS
jgi:hypothetical protein